MKEFWKDIKDFEGKYQISNHGEIKSLNFNNTKEAKILKPKINKQGHLEITLNKNDKHYYREVSRLMIETYTDIELNRNLIITYIDGNKTNCDLTNLKVITRGKMQENTYDNNKRYRQMHEYYGEILPLKEIARRNNITAKIIRDRMAKLYWNVYEASEIPLSIYKKKGEKHEG